MTCQLSTLCDMMPEVNGTVQPAEDALQHWLVWSNLLDWILIRLLIQLHLGCVRAAGHRGAEDKHHCSSTAPVTEVCDTEGSRLVYRPLSRSTVAAFLLLSTDFRITLYDTMNSSSRKLGENQGLFTNQTSSLTHKPLTFNLRQDLKQDQ